MLTINVITKMLTTKLFFLNIVEGIWQFLCDYGLIILFPKPDNFLPKSQFSVIIYFFIILNLRPLNYTENITENSGIEIAVNTVPLRF